MTHAVSGDARDANVLRALGVRNYDCAIVATGNDVGNSALITLNLKEIGVKQVVCKAQSHVHRKVLEKIGADRVVFLDVDRASSWPRGFPVPMCSTSSSCPTILAS